MNSVGISRWWISFLVIAISEIPIVLQRLHGNHWVFVSGRGDIGSPYSSPNHWRSTKGALGVSPKQRQKISSYNNEFVFSPCREGYQVSWANPKTCISFPLLLGNCLQEAHVFPFIVGLKTKDHSARWWTQTRSCLAFHWKQIKIGKMFITTSTRKCYNKEAFGARAFIRYW